jgi:hypothetical protein
MLFYLLLWSGQSAPGRRWSLSIGFRMKQIGTDIIARMLHDYHKCELLALKAIPGFSINSVSYEMLGPVFDNDYGLLFSFKYQIIANIDFEPFKWFEKN